MRSVAVILKGSDVVLRGRNGVLKGKFLASMNGGILLVVKSSILMGIEATLMPIKMVLMRIEATLMPIKTILMGIEAQNNWASRLERQIGGVKSGLTNLKTLVKTISTFIKMVSLPINVASLPIKMANLGAIDQKGTVLTRGEWLKKWPMPLGATSAGTVWKSCPWRVFD